IKKLADDHDIGILCNHHDRKMGAADALDTVSGSIGITAAVDTILLLKRDRGEHDAILHVTGRDIDERELALGFDKETCHWSVLGTAEQYHAKRASETQRILDIVAENKGPMSVKQILEKVRETTPDKSENAIRIILSRASKGGKLKSDGEGNYSI